MFLFQQAFCHFSWLKGGVGENTDGTPFPEKRYTSPLNKQINNDTTTYISL